MRIDTQVVLDEVAVRCPSSSGLLRDVREPLGEYVRRVYTPDVRPESPLSVGARAQFEGAVARLVRRAGVAVQTGEEHWAVPVLQTGPHHRLAFDDDYFSTLAFSVLGSAAAGHGLNVMFNCATITLEEQVRRGPAWLRARSEPVRVFDIPRRTLAKKSTLLFDEPVRVSDELVDRLAALTAAVGLPFDIEAVAGHRGSVRDHITAVNGQVFEQLRAVHGVGTVVLDEWFFADLLADTLQSDSLLSRIFGDGRLRRAVRLFDEPGASPVRRFIPNATDLFWLNKDGKVRPLRLVDDRLCSPKYDFSVPFDAPAVIAALRARVLVPSLFLVFCLCSLLPLVRAVGGAYQAVYHEAFTGVICALLDERRPDERLLLRELRREALVAWGHNLISGNAIDHLAPAADGRGVGFSADLLGMSIAELSDDLSAFTCDELWAQLCG